MRRSNKMTAGLSIFTFASLALGTLSACKSKGKNEKPQVQIVVEPKDEINCLNFKGEAVLNRDIFIIESLKKADREIFGFDRKENEEILAFYEKCLK